MKRRNLVSAVIMTTLCAQAATGRTIPFHDVRDPQQSKYAVPTSTMCMRAHVAYPAGAWNSDTSEAAVNPESENTRIEKHDSTLTYHDRFFFAVGYGLPTGGRLEAGYNLGAFLSFGLALGYLDTWSNKSTGGSGKGEGNFGGVVRLHLPITNLSFVPFFSVCSGSELALFNEPSSYTTLYFGGLVPIGEQVHLRPEAGIARTPRHVSGGKTLGGSTPVIRDDEEYFGINLCLEVGL